MNLPVAWACPGIYLITFAPTGERYLGSALNVRARLKTHFTIPASRKPGSGWRARLMERGLSLEEITARSTPQPLLFVEAPAELGCAETELQFLLQPELNGHTGGRRGGGRYCEPRDWSRDALEEYLDASGEDLEGIHSAVFRDWRRWSTQQERAAMRSAYLSELVRLATQCEQIRLREKYAEALLDGGPA